MSTADRLPPGIADPIPIHHTQVTARDRLHEAAYHGLKGTKRITVEAVDVLALLNALWQETQRADRAEARLEAMAAANGGQAAPSAN